MAHESNRGRLRNLGGSQLRLADPAEDTRGRRVFDLNGNEVGQVEDLVVDESSRKVRFVRVVRRGVRGEWQAALLVPIDAVVSVSPESIRVARGAARDADEPAPPPRPEREAPAYDDHRVRPFGPHGYPRYREHGYEGPDYLRF